MRKDRGVRLGLRRPGHSSWLFSLPEENVFHMLSLGPSLFGIVMPVLLVCQDFMRRSHKAVHRKVVHET